MTPTTGSLGTVTFGDLIGRGGFGSVYRARLEGIERDFAAKVLDPSPFNRDLESLRKRFYREAEILLDLRHPHIPALNGFGETGDGRPFMLMELFPGHDLVAVRGDYPDIPPAAILDFLLRVVDALDHAHQKGFVHRDIKPSNLMTSPGDARVLDFGIAAILDPDNERFTREGGTPVGGGCAAPELIEQPRLTDPRCDVYSLGACWLYALTGREPQGREWGRQLKAVPGMTPSYEAVVLKCLDSPDRRYRSMQELRADIEQLQEGKTTAAAEETRLSDNAVVVAGLIGANGEGGTATRWIIEQRLVHYLESFGVRMAISELEKRGLIETEFETPEPFGTSQQLLSFTASGKEWLSENHDGIAERLHRLRDNPAVADDAEIPF